MAAQAASRPSRPDRNQPRPKPKNPRQAKRSHQVRDVQQLQEAVDAFDEQSTEIKTFSHLPLSEPTAEGLQASHFQSLTDIQARAIPLALKGRDLLGAAKTGSGKTLAFLVPVLEKLHRARWTELDGLGALILSPTRELAVQTFEVLRKIGRRHPFSAGLVIGGKSLREEADRLGRMNILVCTPGRMLQHLDQTVGLDVDSLQVLVLDEADRIMDLGFQRDVDALLEHLPPGRQTLMFSATQSRKVSDLARLSLRDPEYVSVHEAAAAATPAGLQQHYIVVPLPDKINTLWGFVKANLKSKMIVFLSSGKQVRFAYEAFRQLRPAISLLHLHGRQRQLARLAVTEKFTAAQSACLFATDVVARGMDFPAVDWVIQVDCPESADTYIHRVGRTARYESSGRAVLFLDPSEEAGMLRRLEQKKVPIQKLTVRERKKKSIRSELQSMCFKSTDMKYLGQKAFISYAKSIHRHADKEIFNLDSLDCGAFAASLGLPGAPQIRLQKGDGLQRRGNIPYALLESSSEDSESGGDDGGKAKPKAKAATVRTKYDRMVERVNQDVLSGHYTKIVDDGDGTGTDREADEQEEFLSVKRRIPNDDDPAEEDEAGGGQDAYALAAKKVAVFGSQPFVVDSKRREKILLSKKKMLKYMPKPEKIVFDEEGNPGSAYGMKTEEDFRRAGAPEEQRQHFLDTEATRVQEDDIDDKALAKQKRREKKLKRKAREGPLGREDESAGAGAGPGLMDQDGADADPLALLRSLPIAGSRVSADEQSDSEPEAVQEERPRKKARVSDGDESGGGGGAAESRPKDGGGAKKARKRKDGRRHEEREDYGYGPSNLEDLEALAIGLLDV